MNLKRQLLLVSLLTLVLPWAGCKFIRETESALRAGQQQMLAGTALAVAETLSKYPEEFPLASNNDHSVLDQLYGHRLDTAPEIDGYFDDWNLGRDALRDLPGVDGPIRFALGLRARAIYLYVEVVDRNVVYATPETVAVDDGPRFADRVGLINISPPYLNETLTFAAEAPGPITPYTKSATGFAPAPTVHAMWQDGPRGYRLEARIPRSILGTHLGIEVNNTSSEIEPAIRSASFVARTPGAFVSASPDLTRIAAVFVQPGMRMLVTDAAGWRIATVGGVAVQATERAGIASTWVRIVYNALVESAQEVALAEPDASGREQQRYIAQALDGNASVSLFRSAESGTAIVAVAQPIVLDAVTIGAVVLQQGTDAILSLTNQSLARLINATLIATLLVAATLLGYATWLSRRIRRLSVAAEHALDNGELHDTLPSASSGDEVGDLSRSFSHVLRQLGDYNDYLRTLATKLSHELRTPLAIVTSSLENLEHEALNEASAGYTTRARGGADRLRRILTAMSEASRVEELMQHADAEDYDLYGALCSTVAAYRDVYASRVFEFETLLDAAPARGSPELIIQMLDKLVDNAVDFSDDGDTITIGLQADDDVLRITVANPGPPLPERMRTQLFDSMVSVRPGKTDQHLGLGLYVAKLIAVGHGGTIRAHNRDGGVQFAVSLPMGATTRQGK